MRKINIMIIFLSNISLSGNNGKDVNYVDYGFQENGQPVYCQCTNESAVRRVVGNLANKVYDDGDGNKFKQKLDWMFVICSKQGLSTLDAKDENGNYRYTDELGNPLSQYGFFRRRLLNIIPDFDTITGYNEDDESPLNNKVNFNEDYDSKNVVKSMDEAMHCVAELSEKIFERLKGENLSNVTIHADMSGGFRFVSMMLMSVLRLMQYRGIAIGEMLYSNLIYPKKTHGYIERTNPIYGLLDMVSGAEEFYKYGSVNTLEEYFREVKQYGGCTGVSNELSNLIKAMKFFADEVRLCHYASMKIAANNLRDAINNFQKKSKDNKDIDVRERLLGTLTPLFNESYGEFFTEKIDDIVLIKWCLKHDCLQQALTLYFERLHHILTKNNIIVFSPKYEQMLKDAYEGNVDKYEGRLDRYKPDGKRPEEFAYWCLKNVKAPDFDDRINITEENLIRNKRIECAKLFVKYVREKKMKSVSDFADSINNALSNSYYKVVLSNYSEVMSLYEAIYKCLASPKLLLPGSEDKLLYNSLNIIINVDEIMKDEYRDIWVNAKKGFERVNVLRKILQDLSEDTVLRRIMDIQYEWKGYSSWIGHCIDSGIYDLNDKFSREDIMRILNNYDILQDERNNSNHAKDNVKYRYNTADELSQAISDEIKFIENKLHMK